MFSQGWKLSFSKLTKHKWFFDNERKLSNQRLFLFSWKYLFAFLIDYKEELICVKHEIVKSSNNFMIIVLWLSLRGTCLMVKTSKKY